MEGGLVQRHSQTITLAPQLRQGLKLLSMNLPDLRAEVLAEMAQNPVIYDVKPTLESTTISERVSKLAKEERSSDYPDDEDMRDAAYLEGFNRGSSGADTKAIERRQKFFESQVQEETLEQHLVSQLASSDVDEADYPLAEMLIGELDDDGRFVGSIPDIVMVSGETVLGKVGVRS